MPDPATPEDLRRAAYEVSTWGDGDILAARLEALADLRPAQERLIEAAGAWMGGGDEWAHLEELAEAWCAYEAAVGQKAEP